jgi:hypothetical protein
VPNRFPVADGVAVGEVAAPVAVDNREGYAVARYVGVGAAPYGFSTASHRKYDRWPPWNVCERAAVLIRPRFTHPKQRELATSSDKREAGSVVLETVRTPRVVERCR